MHGAVPLIELGAIILALGLLGAVSVRFSISPIPLYLLAGLAFGQGGILPLGAPKEFITTGAEIGVILLLFTLGLEYTAGELVGTLRSSAVSGLVDLILNAAPGVVAALLLGWGPVAAPGRYAGRMTSPAGADPRGGITTGRTRPQVRLPPGRCVG